MQISEVKQKIASVEGWMADGEPEFLYHAAKNAQGEGVIVEIGSYKGKSTIALAAGSRLGSGKRVYAIDPHMTDVEQKLSNAGRSSLDDFKNNIETAGVSDMVETVVAKSGDHVKNWNQPISFLWIDGDHSYEGAKRDLVDWEPHVIENGVVAYHDSTYAEVDRVVRELMFKNNNYTDFGIVGTITYARKVSRPLTFKEKLHKKYVLLLHYAHAWFRKIPLPRSLRNAFKKLGRTVLRHAH